MTESDPSASDGEHVWEEGWEGHERLQRERMAKLTFAQKLAWLEEAHRLVMQLHAGRAVKSDDQRSTGK